MRPFMNNVHIEGATTEFNLSIQPKKLAARFVRTLLGLADLIEQQEWV